MLLKKIRSHQASSLVKVRGQGHQLRCTYVRCPQAGAHVLNESNGERLHCLVVDGMLSRGLSVPIERWQAGMHAGRWVWVTMPTSYEHTNKPYVVGEKTASAVPHCSDKGHRGGACQQAQAGKQHGGVAARGLRRQLEVREALRRSGRCRLADPLRSRRHQTHLECEYAQPLWAFLSSVWGLQSEKGGERRVSILTPAALLSRPTAGSVDAKCNDDDTALSCMPQPATR